MSAPSVPRISLLPRALSGSLEFWWEPPASDGGSPITGYTLSCANPSLTYSYDANTYYAWLQGLTNGVEYNFELTATNANGTGPAATYLVSFPGTPSTPPTSVVPVAYNQQSIAVSYSPPTSNTTPILNYYATATNIANSNVYDFTANSSTPSVVIPVPDTLSSFYNVQVQAYSAPGWSELSAPSSQQTSAPQVYGCYISNCVYDAYPVIDAQGNTWITGYISNNALTATLYNRFGVDVQTISPTAGRTTSIIAYISADGVSNCWMARITSTNPFGFNANNQNLNSQRGLIDSQGNFILIGGLTGPNVFYDKNNTIIQSNSINGVHVVKFSSTGVYGGSGDANTWIAYFRNTNNIAPAITNFILDRNDNILFSSQIVNTSGSPQTLNTFNKQQTQFGTSIPLRTGTGYAIFVKIASNGSSTGSWNAYFTIDPAQVTVAPSAIQYNENIQVNSSNQIIWCVRYRGLDNQVYGSDNVKIGANLPYTAGANNQDTCIVRLAEDGTAANSWRVVLQSLSNTFSEASLNAMVDASDNIIGVGWVLNASAPPTTFYALNTSDSQVTNMNFSTIYASSMYIVKYNNSGVPQWVASLQGGNGVAIGLTTGNINGVPQNTRAKLDASGNVIITGQFSSSVSGATLDLYNASATLLKSITSPSTNVTQDTFIAKLSSNGATGYLARIGQVSGGVALATVPHNLLIDVNQNILVSGQWADNPTGFFVHTNDSVPAYSTFQGPAGISNNNNTYIARFDPILSTVSVAVLKISNASGFITAPIFITLDSNQAPICAGTTGYNFNMFDFNQSTISTCTRNVTPGAFGTSMFISKFAGNDTDSWSGLVTRADTGASLATNYLFSPASYRYVPFADLRVNLSTNRIYGTGFASTAIHTLYDGYNSTVQLLGSASSTNASTNTFLFSFPADGKTFRQN